MRFERLEIDSKKTTPMIKFIPQEGIMEISGESYPENSVEFYEPIMVWLQGFFDSEYEGSHIDFNFKLNYFNTSSSKSILDILDLLEENFNSGKDISVNWYYEEDDEDILESGEEFAEGLNILFNLIAY